MATLPTGIETVINSLHALYSESATAPVREYGSASSLKLVAQTAGTSGE